MSLLSSKCILKQLGRARQVTNVIIKVYIRIKARKLLNWNNECTFSYGRCCMFFNNEITSVCTTKKYLAHWYLFQTGCVLLVLLIPIFTGARLDGKRYIRHVNTEPFLLFTYVIRLNNDMQECLGLERTHAVLNLTRFVFYCCRASCENWHKWANELDMMCIASNQGDSRTRIMMHKRTNSCPDKWPHRWLASLGCYL